MSDVGDAVSGYPFVHIVRVDWFWSWIGRTIVGGIFWVIYQRIVQGQTEQIETLLPDLVDFALTPYIGAESAQRATARL